MRKILSGLAFLPVLLTGCQSFGGSQPSIGWQATNTVGRPSSLDVHTPVLTGQAMQGGTSASALPIGGAGFVQQPLFVGPPIAAQASLTPACVPGAPAVSGIAGVRVSAAGECTSLQDVCNKLDQLSATLKARTAAERLPMPMPKGE